MIKNCDNCAHYCHSRRNPCDFCVAAQYEGVRISDPSNWMPKAPEIVICNECQHREDSEVRDRIWCRKLGRYMQEDGFCSLGERKDNGN